MKLNRWVQFVEGMFPYKTTLKHPFHWTAIPLRLWRSRIFSIIIPNRRWSVDSRTILGLDASSTLPLRFYHASVTLLLRSHYDNEDLDTLSLRWWRCSCDLATTFAMELRFRCAFVSFLYRILNSGTLLLRPRRFYCALAVSVTILVISTKISNRSGIAVQWNGGGGYCFGSWNWLSLFKFNASGCILV